ncbi:cation diffusion facilitator family transporter [Nonomuraea aurantiaca]|jgi:cation diffusion facilitator family transporter|uniref:cation diffusion facilitator family transporter n=1 Tax=Nonomuraea aurantiaca TaxID=2878562 RepID=UPI001CDA149E|nr:cation diffusion facilitator family transporter [Nonomuraea aurantiaca]MCA2228356.1 cation diffusion facilitator family transporter [Nonomuraea aurantiaca]
MSGDGSHQATLAALAANVGVAATKFVAFFFTGSSAMLAEGIHSIADTGNQGLLMLGRRRAKREPSADHPFGYGRERYFYGFLVSLVLFFGGGLFALYEGYEKIAHPHPLESWPWAVGVLVAAIVMESLSLRTAVRNSNRVRGGRSWAGFIRDAKAPELPVVLLEDTAALAGLVFALVGVGLTVLTGNSAFDGLGSIAIGLLLVAVAVTLARETKSMIIGEAATPAVQDAIEKVLDGDPSIQAFAQVRTLHLGPEDLLIAARVTMHSSGDVDGAAQALAETERRIREQVSIASAVYLQPTPPERVS